MVIAYNMVKKAYDEGYAEGRAEAFALATMKVSAYHKRMREAHERGEEFNEPPPRFGDEKQERD